MQANPNNPAEPFTREISCTLWCHFLCLSLLVTNAVLAQNAKAKQNKNSGKMTSEVVSVDERSITVTSPKGEETIVLGRGMKVSVDLQLNPDQLQVGDVISFSATLSQGQSNRPLTAKRVTSLMVGPPLSSDVLGSNHIIATIAQLSPIMVKVDPKNNGVYTVEQLAGVRKYSNQINIAGRMMLFEGDALKSYKTIPVRDNKLLPLTRTGYQVTIIRDPNTNVVREINVRSAEPVSREALMAAEKDNSQTTKRKPKKSPKDVETKKPAKSGTRPSKE